MKQLISILIVFIALPIRYGYGQQFNFRNYSVKEGVAQSQIYALLQDTRGYLWLGTRGGGISRFDGLKFKTYSKKDGLASNYIFCIKENRKGNLLIGTNNGLSIYNGIKFVNYGVRTGDTTQFWILDIVEGVNSEIWLATNQGLFTLNNGILTNISEKIGEKSLMINTIIRDKIGNIYYGTALGLSKIIIKNNQYQNVKLFKSSKANTGSVNTLKIDSKGTIWMGTYNNGLFYYKNDSALRITDDPVLNKQSIFDIYFDDQNNLWLATLHKGVGIFNSIARSITWIGEQEGISNNHVRSICKDKNGNYWFGTSGGGVCNYFGNKFTTYDKSSGLTGNFIYSVFKDSKNRLFIGTSDKGFCILDSGKFHSYGHNQGFGDLKVKAICEDNYGNILLGTEANGLFRFNGDSFVQIKGLEKKYIRYLLKDENNDVYVATAGAGVFILSGQNLDSNLIQITINNGLLSNRISCLHQDNTGRIWYGTENNGFGFIKNKKADPNVYTIRDGMPSNAIRCLTEDKSGNLWIGTAGNGIASKSLYQGSSPIHTYDYKNGLSSSNIYLMSMDENNKLFIGSETGLDLLELDANGKVMQV
ncbi:MAG: hypothetical protein IT245_00590, partial [Bacteroidia bacterium]|nr:hypothetical protein [Bacteroidia bacterium]